MNKKANRNISNKRRKKTYISYVKRVTRKFQPVVVHNKDKEMYKKVCYTCKVVVVVVVVVLLIWPFNYFSVCFPFSLPSSFSTTRLQWLYPLYIRRENVEAASIAWIFHEIRPVSYRRVWNGFLVFCLAVFSTVWDRTPCHPVLNYLASNVGRVTVCG